MINTTRHTVIVITCGFITLLQSGCVTVDENIKLTSSNSEQSALLIYRDKNKFIGAGGFPTLGTDAGYFAQLENGQYIELPIDSGVQTLLSKFSIGQPNELTLQLEPNKMHCVKATYNLNIGITLGASASASSQSKGFGLRETECPLPDELSQLTKIELGHTVQSPDL